MPELKKFLLCSWNSFDKKKNDWETDPLAKDIARLLKAKGWSSVDQEKEASLVVLVPRHVDLKNGFSIADAQIFHTLLAGVRKHVLLVDRMGNFQTDIIYNPEWFFCIRNCDFDEETFDEWLEYATNEKLVGHPIKVCVLKRLAKILYKNRDFPTLLNKAYVDELSESGKLLLKAQERPSFYYGILRTSAKYDKLEHDLKRQGSNSFTDEATNVQQAIRKKTLLDFCYDLRKALYIHAAWKRSSPFPQNYILVIDDNPERVYHSLNSIISHLLPRYKLYFWMPPNSEFHHGSENELLLNDLVTYSSLQSNRTILSDKMVVNFDPKKPHGIGRNCQTIKKILANTRYILVDMLFSTVDSREEPIGIQVIKGLRRFFIDLHLENPLDIIALSRADDLNKVQLALQAGATGYTLKSRLLTLPAMLSKPDVEIHESVNNLRRNFRLLYHLPDNTIKYLHTVKIPRKDFSRAPNVELTRMDEALQKILIAIPKTDLHVHVGSCMSPEFLVVASFIMLLQNKAEEKEQFREAVSCLMNFFRGKEHFCISKNLSLTGRPLELKYSSLVQVAKETRKYLLEELEYYARIPRADQEKLQHTYKVFRSILYKDLGIPDYLEINRTESKLEGKQDVTLFLFFLTHKKTTLPHQQLSGDDILRCFLLFLAANKYCNKDSEPNATMTINIQILKIFSENILEWFRCDKKIDLAIWEKLRSFFWPHPSLRNQLQWDMSTQSFRGRNWDIFLEDMLFVIDLDRTNTTANLLHSGLDEKHDPISYYLASGTRCTNLKTYLEGCEMSGAEHLRHPFLIHLYAQQTVFQFVQQGVMYAELRAAVSGYENRKTNFTFQDACNCMKAAFENAQKTVKNSLQNNDADDGVNRWLWQKNGPSAKPLQFDLKCLTPDSKQLHVMKPFPIKVSLILTGKRHKPTRQMLREAASATVLHTSPDSDVKSSQKFVQKDMDECRLVGFDLAGQEDLYPPELFRGEFEQISKMHIPITVHAGENAPSEFVERAILDLRARRIGHGLALANDTQLMKRAREERICLELCPVSNFQTNQVIPADKDQRGRKYPLKKFLISGNAVCINTDNPLISHTNMIKECFQASFAYGDNGLSLWELLRIFRMGFVHSFLNLPERRAMLELADQIIFDLFSEPVVTEGLEQMVLAD